MKCERHQPPIFRGESNHDRDPAPGVKGPRDLEPVDRFAKLRGRPVGHFVVLGKSWGLKLVNHLFNESVRENMIESLAFTPPKKKAVSDVRFPINQVWELCIIWYGH